MFTSSERRRPYENLQAGHWVCEQTSKDEILEFHRTLPGFSLTPLTSLPEVAKELGVAKVFVKEESQRCGLPSFKILGASWAAHCAICASTHLPVGSELSKLADSARLLGIVLVAATDGNHGRAVARMASLMKLGCRIMVPWDLDEDTIQRIRSEGAEVTVMDCDYDATVLLAKNLAESIEGGMLIQDTTLDGYEDIPQWAVDGYSTMMVEIDMQLDGKTPDLVVTPVGVGSLAQAVVSHSKATDRHTKVLTVEPDAAACLYKSLRNGAPVPVPTRSTIMSGMNCGTVSTNAWPILQNSVDFSVTVSDGEAHEAVEDLHSMGVHSGPCGAATLAALRFVTNAGLKSMVLTKDSVVVLLSTEAPREYKTPLDVRISDPVALTQTLVRIDSTNPDLSKGGGVGEKPIAEFITAWLEHRDIETHWLENTPGRPSVVGVIRGTGGGKSIMMNGHLDTVTTAGYDGDPVKGDIKDGCLYGRGTFDMKAGVAAALVSLMHAEAEGLRGDVIFAGVADEEHLSFGTEEVINNGWRADGAVVLEPTCLDIVLAHKGFVWIEVDIYGRAAHGSRYDLGVDAISKAGYFLVELDNYSQEILTRVPDPQVGTGSVHACLIQGGEEASSYPAKCTITIERRTIPGETSSNVMEEVEKILKALQATVTDFKYDIRLGLSRPPFQIPQDHHLVACTTRSVEQILQRRANFRGEKFWTDCALLAEKGIPSLLFGVDGGGAHAASEWATVESIEQVVKVLTLILREFCE